MDVGGSGRFEVAVNPQFQSSQSVSVKVVCNA